MWHGGGNNCQGGIPIWGFYRAILCKNKYNNLVKLMPLWILQTRIWLKKFMILFVLHVPWVLYLAFLPLHKAKWVQLNGKTLQVLKTSLNLTLFYDINEKCVDGTTWPTKTLKSRLLRKVVTWQDIISFLGNMLNMSVSKLKRIVILDWNHKQYVSVNVSPRT